MSAKKAAKSSKHAASKKHKAATAKHTLTKKQAAHLHTLHVEHEAHLAHLKATGHAVTAKAKSAAHAKATKKVAFAVGDWLPVCGFEAVAQSLRLAGQRVHGDEVAELWELCGSPEATSVEDALAAAALFGLAGCRLLSAEHVAVEAETRVDRLRNGVDFSRELVNYALRDRLRKARLDLEVHGLILRIDRPGPHAVLATADGWWSWGELHSPWACTIEAAWAVSWGGAGVPVREIAVRADREDVIRDSRAVPVLRRVAAPSPSRLSPWAVSWS